MPSGLLPNLATPSFLSTASSVPASSQETDSLAAPPRYRPLSERPQVLRKSTSDDSLLYHSLSRVSSLGDDGRWENTREQINSRFKAIMDSLPDVPTFKLPQLPSELSALLFSIYSKKQSLKLESLRSLPVPVQAQQSQWQ